MATGSTSMTEAKNNMGESKSAVFKTADKLLPSKKLRRKTNAAVAKAAIKKLITNPDLFNFLTINKPPRRINGARYKLPTHQLADRLKITAVSTAAKAAGLKICFLFTARIYFEA